MTRVLVVEDDTQTANEIRAALGDYGLDVERAATGREGLLKAAAESYDAIVLDRMLPGGLDGLGVLATLRAAGEQAPVLILSALSAVDERVRGLRAGGDDYLTKPFDFLELLPALMSCCAAIPARNAKPCYASALWRWICSRTSFVTAATSSNSSRASIACWNI